jgi:peptide/nickel transport system substrate-binding protein
MTEIAIGRTAMLRGTRVSRRNFLAGMVATGGLAAAACGGGGEDEETETPAADETVVSGEPVYGGTLHVATTAPVLSLDPHTTEGVAAASYFYSYLVHVTDWQGNVGDLAESWEIVDELDWIFHLRSGARFQDLPPVSGREVVADDIVYSIDRLRALPGAIEQWDQWTDKYEAPDARTFTLRTTQPYGYMLMTLGSPLTAIIPREAIDEFGDLESNVLGSGPFMLDRFGRDEGIDIVRNPTYYRPEIPYIDGISTKVMPDDSSIQAAFRSGNLDVYNASNKLKADAVRDVGGVTIQSYLSRSYAVLDLNAARQEAFKDPRVREAIDLATDRKEMIDKLHFGGAELAGPVGPLWDSSLPADEIEAAYTRDVQKAKQLLAEADMEDLSFKLSFATIGNSADLASIIQQNLAEIGVRVELQPGELGAWLANLLSGNFEATSYSHLPYLSDDIQLQSHHTYGFGRTDGGYRGVEDDEVDGLLDQIHEAIDEEDRIELARDVQRKILDRHGPVLVLYEPYGYWCARDYVKGYTPTAYGFGLYKYDYWIDKA